MEKKINSRTAVVNIPNKADHKITYPSCKSNSRNNKSILKKLVLSNIKKSKKNKNYFRIKKIGNKILYNNIKEIDKFLKNEDKKAKLLG